MKKYFLILLLFICTVSISFAQNNTVTAVTGAFDNIKKYKSTKITFLDSTLFNYNVRILGAFRNIFNGFGILNTGTIAALYYQGPVKSNVISAQADRINIKYTRSGIESNIFMLNNDSLQLSMKSVLSTYWDTLGNANFLKPIHVGATADTSWIYPVAGLGMNFSVGSTNTYSAIRMRKGYLDIFGDAIVRNTLYLDTNRMNNYIKHQAGTIYSNSGTGFTWQAGSVDMSLLDDGSAYPFKVGANTSFNYNIFVSDSAKLNVLQTTGNSTLRDNIYLDTCSGTGGTANYGVIYKGGIPFIHDFRHLTGNTARPAGGNVFISGSGNFTTGSTATATTMASNNIGISNALKGLTTGYDNIALGNTALNATTIGAGNIAIGTSAGRYISTGDLNIIIGRLSANSIKSSVNLTNSSSSIFIGNAVIANANTETNQIVIGAAATGNGSNTVTLGKDVTLWTISQNILNTAVGGNLTIQAQSTVAGGTADQNGGMFTANPGVTKGMGFASLRLGRNDRQISTATTLNTVTDAFIIPSAKLMADNTSTTLLNLA